MIAPCGKAKIPLFWLQTPTNGLLKMYSWVRSGPPGGRHAGGHQLFQADTNPFQVSPVGEPNV